MILDRLPPRITGFFDRAEPPLSLDPKDFKRACHLVAQMEGGSVESVDLALAGRSYFVATARTPTDYVSVLANSVYRYLAFVPPGSFGADCHELTFVEPISLAGAFSRATEFQPLDAAWLATAPRTELLTDLAPVEFEQVKYWRPQTVGDVIFNCWD
jgi:hypothetical protein